MSKEVILELVKQLQEGYGDVINVTFHEGGDKYDIREGLKLSNGKTASLRGTCHVEACLGHVQADIHLYHVSVSSEEELLETFVHELGHYLAYRKRFSFCYQEEEEIIRLAQSVSDEDEIILDVHQALSVLEDVYGPYDKDQDISDMLAEIDGYNHAINLVELLDEAGLMEKSFFIRQQIACFKTYQKLLALPEDRREEFAAFIEELKAL